MKYLDRLIEIKKQIGKTSIVELVFSYKGKETTLFAKEEFLNPSKSIKIRPAYQILFDAINEGKLVEGQRVVEVTSGNMGISLAYICKIIGNPITILMPKTMSKERIDALKKLGADVILTEDFLDGFDKINEYIKNGAYCSKQFENPSNLKAYFEMADEIIEEIPSFDGFISGVGTGGTLIGTGSILKNKCGVKLIAIDPAESALLKTGKPNGKHKIQGLSDQIVPKLYNPEIVDNLIEISSNDAICMARKINRTYGLSIGISSGANALGAVLSNLKTVVSVFADDDTKYLSTDLYNDLIKSNLVDDIQILSFKRLNKTIF